MIRLTAFKWVPPFAQGLVRDLRARWALEEAGLPYEIELIGQEDQKSKTYRKKQPFGQVPVLEDGELSLFESGAIALHVAEKSPALMPDDRAGRERARVWVFAALNSLEQHIGHLATIDLFNADKNWAKERRPAAVDNVKDRLQKLDDWLGTQDYLEGGRFTVGDLIMTTVLRNLRHTTILSGDFPRLESYRLRCEDRPAFKKALADQMTTFEQNTPK